MSTGTNLFSLEGKVALVTGASGYLGREMCYGFAEAGAHVLLNGRSEQKITALANELQGAGYSCEPAIFDVSSLSQIQGFFEGRTSQLLDILVNNAYWGPAGSIKTSTEQDYRACLEVGFISVHNLVQAALPSMRRAKAVNGDASVINIASMYGMVSPDMRIYGSPEDANPPFYGATKAALIQWTRYAACEFGPEGIRVNSISPGPFPSLEAQEGNKELMEKITSKVPLARLGNAEELKGPALFLASAASTFVSGSNLVVDGGWNAW